MKIALPTMDGTGISPHFGRCSAFAVFEALDGVIQNREIRPNRFTAHARGECNETDAPEQQHHHNDAPHSHAPILQALHDCDIVLCLGMGRRAADDLREAGIHVFALESPMPLDEAVRAFLDGKIQSSGGFCQCH